MDQIANDIAGAITGGLYTDILTCVTGLLSGYLIILGFRYIKRVLLDKEEPDYWEGYNEEDDEVYQEWKEKNQW